MKDRVAGIVGSWEERWRKAIKLKEIGRARGMENGDTLSLDFDSYLEASLSSGWVFYIFLGLYSLFLENM